jgi:tetratricopeptide (TPR) repeat protein/transglutaminase-like putative cysteine protease
MWKFAAAVVVASGWAAGVRAEDLQQVRLGPPAAWVQPAADGIKADVPDDGAAARFLLMDSQLHFGTEGASSYAETVMRLQTPEGLQAMSTVSLPWDPALGGLTVHKLQIIRGKEVIDLLAKQKFTVLRRESNLEAQELDGVLTAVLQPEDLRVGDIVDMAFTLTSKDPALAGHVQWAISAPNIAIDDLRMRASADQRSIYWRAGEDVDGLKAGVTGEGKAVSTSMKAVQPILPPQGAPTRYRWGRFVQFSDFKSWADVSAVMAPLYAKAATVGTGSPLQAEIARIKAASADPKARAEAALALVQDQVRYVALSMDDGGYVPADADVTWKRRFGDCKGKTTLLLALLHGLGIEAQPTLVNATDGDGMDQRLPSASVFDHVLVRATIAGRVYWLDGTRLGDRRLDDIETPDMSWTLPIQAQGATLTRLSVPPAERPVTVTNLRLDASKGLDVPAAAHGEVLFRGDAAVALNSKLSDVTAAQRDQGLRAYWTGTYSYVTPTTVTAKFDPVTREERFVMDGVATLAWDPGTPGGRFFLIDGSSLGWTPDFSRSPGPHADAPFVVAYPVFSEAHETVILPNKGAGFFVHGENFERKAAGRSFSRQARLDKGVFTLDATLKSLAPEFPASEAEEAAKTLKEMAKDSVYIGASDSYRMTREEVDQYRKKTLTTAKDLMKRGEAMRQRGYVAQARSDMEAAIALDAKDSDQFVHVAEVYAMQGDFAAAHEALKKALALKPDDIKIDRMAGYVAMLEPNFEEAAVDFGKALAKDPKDAYSRRERAAAYQDLGRIDEALADAEAMLKENAKDDGARSLKINILIQAGRIDQALAEADAAIAADPKASVPHMAKAAVLDIAHRQADAQAEYDALLALNRNAQGYITRSTLRPAQDYAAQLKDLDEALKLDPGNLNALTRRAAVEAQHGQFDKALADANAALEEDPDNVALRQSRAFVYARAGKSDLALADMEWARGQIENLASNWNGLCYNQAMWNLSLDKALADCDKALSLSPRSAPILDSRAFVLFRLGRVDEALHDYTLALKIAPRQVDSLYGRGLAELQKGQVSEGRADLELARRLQPRIDETFAEYGVKPPAAYASSNSATR